MKTKIFYYLHALVTLKPSQLFWYVNRRFLSDSKKDVVLDEQVKIRQGEVATAFLAYPMQASGPGYFRFLNRERCFDTANVDWISKEMPRLWRYNLHYFDFLQDPEIADKDKYFLIEDWLKKNPIGTQTAWEPYTVSLRIVNWIKFLLRFDGRVSPSVVRSLALQSHWLYQNIELHILANHLFKNIKALLFAGTWLQGEAPDKWFARGQILLDEQLREQLLADGGHYERSPMYHSIFVEDLLDLLNYRVPDGYRNETLALLENSALQASLFLRDIRMPDGQIPLFNDAAFAIAPEPDVILDYACRVLNKDLSDTQHFPRQISFPATGYFIIGEGDNRLIIDCGETGPRYQPGHTHCDTLSFELAIKGQRVIVDTGTYDYEPGAKRRYDRSTAAHNTLMIDGIDQSEVWGLFRVARRASPLSADLSIEADGKAVFRGSHDGYQRLRSKLTHERQVNFDPARGWRIEDTVTGQGEHRIESFIHLHPRLQPQENGGQGFRLLDADGKAVAEIVIAEGLDADVSNTVYHPQFGVEQPCKVIRILYKGEVPATLGYDINIL